MKTQDSFAQILARKMHSQDPDSSTPFLAIEDELKAELWDAIHAEDLIKAGNKIRGRATYGRF